MHLVDVGAQSVVQAQSLRDGKPKRRLRGNTGTLKQKRKEKDPTKQCFAPKSGKKRGGGAWRAFVSVKAHGQKLTGSLLTTLSSEYRHLEPAEFEKYVDLGKVAVTLHRQGAETFNRKSTRLARDKNKREQQQQEAHERQGKAIDQTAAMLGRVASTTGAHHHLATLSKHDIQEELSCVDKETSGMLEQWSEGIGLQTALRSLPPLGPLANQFVAVPDNANMVRWTCKVDSKMREETEKKYNYRHASARRDDADNWRRRHLMILSKDGKEYGFNPGGVVHRPCLEAWYCFHNEIGELVQRFYAKLVHEMKRVFAKGGNPRKMLKEARLFVRFSKGSEAPPQMAFTEGDCWFHVSYSNLRTFRF